MPAETRHTHHLNLEETQLEMSARVAAGENSEDYDGKLRQAAQQLELLQQQREELERQKQEQEELNYRKEEFVSGQIELGERLSSSITSIDRELFELRQELEDLEQTRQSFAAHLDRIEKIEPEAWPQEAMATELSRAQAMIEAAEEEFDGAVAHFSNGRSRGLFGGPGARPAAKRTSGEFVSTMKNGLAFNFPVIFLGTLALLVYLLK